MSTCRFSSTFLDSLMAGNDIEEAQNALLQANPKKTAFD